MSDTARNDGPHRRRRLALAALVTVLGAGTIVALPAVVGAPELPRGERAAPAAGYGQIPLGFEANRGQAPARVEFLARGSGYGVFLKRDEIVLALGRPQEGRAGSKTATLRLGLGGAAKRPLRGIGKLDRRVSYLVGDDPDGRLARVPSYRRVAYDEVYPGIDLVLYGKQSRLEYDFVVAPGADPADIRLSLGAARDVAIDDGGDLVIGTAGGTVRQRKPFVYQRVAGQRREVEGAFALRDGRVGFAIGDYDHARPLVIDPVIEYSTFLGGATGYDHSPGMAVDRDGSAYVAGLTFAADFPATSGSGPGVQVCEPAVDAGFQPRPQETCRSDAFVTKLNRAGTDIVYSTFLGGAGSDRIQDIDVDADGAAYVTGGTDSLDFPTTTGALDRTAAGARRVMGAGLLVLGEAFLAKLAPDGSSLAYSTLLGGSDAEEGMGVKVDPRTGAAFVAGHTFSADFATTAGAYDRALNVPGRPAGGCGDIFVSRVEPAGDALGYSTFVGGGRLEFAWDVDIDAGGSAYVMGESMSADAPTTPDAIQPAGHVRPGSEAGGCAKPLEQLDDADPLILEIGPGGSQLVYATHLGGSRHEHGTAIAVAGGAIYVAGHTNSLDFPTTDGAAGRQPRGTATLFDGFVAKLSADRSRLDYSTLLAGRDDDWVFDIDVDAGGTAYLTGMTASADFPTTAGALDTSYLGPGAPFYDAFVTRLAPDGRRLLYSTLFGGAGPDIGLSIVADGAGSAYVAGTTYSPDLPVTAGAPDPLFNGPAGYSDAFAAKLSGFDSPAAAREPALQLGVDAGPVRATVRAGWRR